MTYTRIALDTSDREGYMENCIKTPAYNIQTLYIHIVNAMKKALGLGEPKDISKKNTIILQQKPNKH